MTDSDLLLVDQGKTTQPVYMIEPDPRADSEFPHLPPRSTPEAFYLPGAAIELEPAVVSATPETNPSNVHGDGPHFARTVEGHPEWGTVCGQDGQSWPCAGWEALTRLPDAEPAEQPAESVTLEAVAAATGLSVQELRTRLNS